jgi:hypothetical protein
LELSKSVGVLNEIIDWHAQVEQSYRDRVQARLAYRPEGWFLFDTRIRYPHGALTG